MCFASLADSVVDTITFSGNLTTFPPNIASVSLAHPIPVFIAGMLTVSVSAEASFSRIRRHSRGFRVKWEDCSGFLFVIRVVLIDFVSRDSLRDWLVDG